MSQRLCEFMGYMSKGIILNVWIMRQKGRIMFAGKYPCW